MPVKYYHKIIISFVLWFSSSLWSESFYNIKGFYGERDTGLGGAYAAISDDPTGIMYNPAGMAFSYHNSITMTSVNYDYTEKIYKDVLGPSRILGSSQNYVRQSKGFNPSFIGVMQSIGEFRFGIAIFSAIPRSIDQFNNASNPVAIRDLADIKIRYTEDYKNTTTGPSLAWKLSEKISMGISLLGFFESNKITQNATFTSKDGRFVNGSQDYQKNNIGQTTILGFMYQFTNLASLGISLKKYNHISGKERSLFQTNFNSVSSANELIFEDSSSDKFGAYIGSDPSSKRNTPIILMGDPRYTGRVPEPQELRIGLAYYPNEKFLISGDFIYTSGYSYSRNVFNYDPFQNQIIFYSREDRLLNLQPTRNFALGLEYYLFNFLSLRLGVFTNNSNLKESSTRLQTLASAISLNVLDEPGLTTSLDSLQISYYFNELLDPQYRNEYTDLIGYSFGLAYETSKTTIGLNLSIQRGQGFSQLLNQFPVDMNYQGNTIYLTTTIKN
jgi:long-subunit fatty acid transport protein